MEDYYNNVEPDGLYEFFSALSSAYAYFGAKAGEEWEEEREYRWALQEAYNTHWQNRVLLHPDVERAKRLLATGDFPKNEDICREILLAEYPEEVPHETAEDFDERSWEYILDDVFANDPEKGMEMWRRLLDIAGPTLKNDTKTAETLLVDWGWMGHPNEEQALQLLISLEDARFVSQLFESAYLCGLQRDILGICRDCREEALARHCLDLAQKNPCLEEGWKKRYMQVAATKSFSGWTKPPVGKPAKPDDGTVFHFCAVQLSGARRTYAYLTGGLPLKAGDWVEIPFGRYNTVRQGQVKAVMDCTRVNVPWSPEQTKSVIRTIDAPAIVPTIEVPAPKAEKRVEQSEEKPEKAEKPAEKPIQVETITEPPKPAPTAQPSVVPQPVGQTPAEPEKPKRKLPWK